MTNIMHEWKTQELEKFSLPTIKPQTSIMCSVRPNAVKENVFFGEDITYYFTVVFFWVILLYD